LSGREVIFRVLVQSQPNFYRNMSAKKSKKKSPVKSLGKKTPVKKPTPKKVKKPVAKKVIKKAKPQKPTKTKVAKKVEQKKKPAAKPVKKTKRKTENKSERHSLTKQILSKKSEKKEAAKLIKTEPGKLTEKKFELTKKAFVVRKSDNIAKLNFKVGDYAIYPSHGVGKIVGIEKNVVVGQNFSCYLMHFERERMTIKIPTNSARKIGLRHPISKTQMDEVFAILRSGIKKLKGMWSRRAQEYETKINSGDIILLAEVIRDLTRDIEDSERSYSERIIYETAIYRLASEYAAIYKITLEDAKEKIITTAKDKLSGEMKPTRKDDFDDFDDFDKEKSGGDEEEEEESEDEEEEDDFDFDDEDGPKKKKKKK